MKTSMQCAVALDFTLLKPGKYIGSLIILSLTLMSVGVIFLLALPTYYVRLGIQEAVSVPPKQIARCYFRGDFAYEDERSARDEIIAIEEISAIGHLDCYRLEYDFLCPYTELQKDHTILDYSGQDEWSFYDTQFPEVYNLGRNFWEYFSLSLLEGTVPKKEKEENLNELYVGYELRDVYPVGTEFEIQNSDGEVCEVFRVSGILEAGSMVMAPEAGETEAEIGALVTDYMILKMEYTDIVTVDGEFFIITDTYEDMKTVQQKLGEIGDRYHVTAMVNILENVLAKNDREIQNDYSQMLYATLLLAVTAVILLLVSQVMEQMDFSEVYGVWYANGASKKDMRKVLFFQNFLRLIPAEIIAGAGTYYIALSIYRGYHHRFVMRQFFFRWMIPAIWIFGLLIVTVAVLVPLFILNRKNAVELLNRRITEGRARARFSKLVRDGRMSGLLILEILLVLLLFTNAAMDFHSYQYAGETVTLNGSYKNQQTLGIDVDWQANIGEDGLTPQIQDSTIDELLEFCESVKDLPVSVTIYFHWMISVPADYAMTGLLLTDSEAPQSLSEGKYESDQQGIYLSETLVPLLESDESGAYLESFHTRFPLLGTVTAKGQESEDSMYVYFQTMEESTQREIITEILRMMIDAIYLEPLVVVVGSNDTEISKTVKAVQEALSGKTMISYKELTTDKAITAISGDQEILQQRALFRLLIIGIVLIFCTVSLLQVISLWMERKRDEITIRWAVGMKKRQIFGALMKEMLFLMAACILFGGIVEMAICWGLRRYSFILAVGYLTVASVGTFLMFSVILVHVFLKSTQSLHLAVLLRE